MEETQPTKRSSRSLEETLESKHSSEYLCIDIAFRQYQRADPIGCFTFHFPDVLTATAHVRLEAHLRDGPAPHILPEDDDLVEENPVEDIQDTEAAFQALLDVIDSSATDGPQPLDKIHYHAMSHLPLTYPWASMVLDLKEVLPVYDHHLTACLIANNAAGSPPPHPGSVLFYFLDQLAQFILNIISPPNAEDPPPFLNHTEIYTKAFWHAHLNYACTQFAAEQRGPERLIGNQLMHWISNKEEACMHITHLCIYVPPMLGAYLLHHHAPKPLTFTIPNPAHSSPEETTVVRLSRPAHFLLPTVIDQQAERLRTARQAAAQGLLSSYPIPLLANTQTLLNKGKISWTLKFPLPLPTRPANRRLSSTH